MTLGPDGLADHGAAVDVGDAIERMAAHVRHVAAGQSFRVGIGDADRPELGDRLTAALGACSGVAELTRYEMGPSVGTHSGTGTVGAVWAPL